MKRALAIAVVAVTAACGGELAPDDDGGRCEVAVQFEPLDAVAPTSIVARATVDGVQGVLTYSWLVSSSAGAIATTPRTPDNRDVEFIAAEPGVYQVELNVTGGSRTCPTWRGDKNVRDPGSTSGAVRLRFTPGPSTTAPIQERVVVVPGGSDFAAGVLAIDPGVSTAIDVRDSGGARVPAYVRLTSRATPDAVVELVTSVTGGERATLASGRHDVLVIPLVPDLAPIERPNWDAAQGGFIVTAGASVIGTVLDGTGAPLADARVSIAAAGSGPPSTLATTGSDGRFVLGWQLTSGASLVVVPPATSGLPRLTAPLATIDLGAPLTVRYQPGQAQVELGGTLVRVGGAPVVNGHVLFALELADIATITDGSTTALVPGAHRDRIATDATGHLAAYRVTVSSGRAFAIADGGPGAVALVDVSTTTTTIDAPAPATLTGLVVDRAGAPLPGVALAASVVDELAHLDAPAPTATSGADGRFTLALAAGASYQLVLDDPRARAARRRLLVAATAGDLGSVALPPPVRVLGTVRLVGQSTGLAEVSVTALCDACTGLERSRPQGETVTDVAGDFTVVVPDPSAPP